MNKTSTRDLVLFCFFISIITLMSFIPYIGFINLFFTRATLIHIPVIIGSIYFGPKKGAILGFIFGLFSLITNTISPTLTSFVFSPFYKLDGIDLTNRYLSLIVVFIPRILVGIVPYFVYNALKKHLKLSLILSGFIGSLVNTLLVMLFILLFFSNAYFSVNDKGFSNIYTLIFYVILINGIPEAIISSILTFLVLRILLKYSGKRQGIKKE